MRLSKIFGWFSIDVDAAGQRLNRNEKPAQFFKSKDIKKPACAGFGERLELSGERYV